MVLSSWKHDEGMIKFRRSCCYSGLLKNIIFYQWHNENEMYHLRSEGAPQYSKKGFTFENMTKVCRLSQYETKPPQALLNMHMLMPIFWTLSFKI